MSQKYTPGVANKTTNIFTRLELFLIASKTANRLSERTTFVGDLEKMQSL